MAGDDRAAAELLARYRSEAAPTGLAALASAVCGVLPQAGLPLAQESALALGGAAFRTYFFAPADNHAWEAVHPEVRWMEESLRVDNYGLLEAIGGHAGVSCRRYTKLSGAEFRALLTHEQEEARWPVIEYGADALRAPEIVVEVAQEAEVWRARASGPEGAEGGDWTLPHRDIEALKAPVKGFAAVLVVRPEPGAVPSPSLRAALERDVLGWALRHQSCEKELVHHADAFFATGLRAWEVAGARAAELLADREAPVEAFAAFLVRWCAEQERAREAAAAWLASGASMQLGEVPAAADAFALSAAAIGALRARLEALKIAAGPAAAPALLELSSAFASVRQAEQAAFAGLEEALD